MPQDKILSTCTIEHMKGENSGCTLNTASSSSSDKKKVSVVGPLPRPNIIIVQHPHENYIARLTSHWQPPHTIEEQWAKKYEAKRRKQKNHTRESTE